MVPLSCRISGSILGTFIVYRRRLPDDLKTCAVRNRRAVWPGGADKGGFGALERAPKPTAMDPIYQRTGPESSADSSGC